MNPYYIGGKWAVAGLFAAMGVFCYILGLITYWKHREEQ
jgi:hypothetical protein